MFHHALWPLVKRSNRGFHGYPVATIAFYGPDDRLLNCNPAFRALYPEIADLMQPGVNYGDLMQAYFRRAPAMAELAWVSLEGERVRLPVPPGAYEGVALSPDGARARTA